MCGMKSLLLFGVTDVWGRSMTKSTYLSPLLVPLAVTAAHLRCTPGVPDFNYKTLEFIVKVKTHFTALAVRTIE